MSRDDPLVTTEYGYQTNGEVFESNTCFLCCKTSCMHSYYCPLIALVMTAVVVSVVCMTGYVLTHPTVLKHMEIKAGLPKRVPTTPAGCRGWLSVVAWVTSWGTGEHRVLMIVVDC